MTTIRPAMPWGLWGTSFILLLCGPSRFVPPRLSRARPGSTPGLPTPGNAETLEGASVKSVVQDRRSLISNDAYTIYGDRSGQMWLGLEGGISRFDSATDAFVDYRPVPENPASLAITVWVIHQDRSGALCAGTWDRGLIRFDAQAKSFVSYTSDSRDPRKTQRRRHQHRRAPRRRQSPRGPSA